MSPQQVALMMSKCMLVPSERDCTNLAYTGNAPGGSLSALKNIRARLQLAKDIKISWHD